jgi:hypothetical protein
MVGSGMAYDGIPVDTVRERTRDTPGLPVRVSSPWRIFQVTYGILKELGLFNDVAGAEAFD